MAASKLVVCVLFVLAPLANGWSIAPRRSELIFGGCRTSRSARVAAVPPSMSPPNAADVSSPERTAAPAWWKTAVAGSVTAAMALLLLTPTGARAENELADIAGGKLDPSFVDKECFVDNCSLQSKACLENADCLKGMTCTAKCMGDDACITGCFAKFGTSEMNSLLKCSIEDHECIKIAVLPPGPDALDAITPPRGTLVKNFEPSSLEGQWYKVMGWNSNYDCFDCQQNTFSRPEGATLTARKGAPEAMLLDVDFSMPRQRREGPPTLYRQTVQEDIVFDAASPLRHAHTEGHMFGLTFWENWSVIGENTKAEPEFKFVYYNGRTRQNTYEGAFVYARTPALPPDAMASVNRLAREAGMDPNKFCSIRNACFLDGGAAGAQKAPTYMGIYAAEAATVSEDDALALLAAPRAPPAAGASGGAVSALDGPWAKMKTALGEVQDFVEDPHASADWMFQQQEKVNWGAAKLR
jgi:hypothetical protein